ncbi:4Fe-4S dicluster domain-containing protein [bacterium]|nr:4Fe-4S dicluster domain-containing protein [bacterium]
MPTIEFSGFQQGFFALAIVGALLIFANTMARRIAVMRAAQPDLRFDHIPRNLYLLVKYGLGQGRMPQEKSAGWLHIFIFFGFMVLSVRTLEIFVMGFAGSEANLHNLPAVGGIVGPVYYLLKDIVAVLVVVGCAGFAWRRLVSRPVRMRGVKHAEAVLILAWIASLMFADFFLEAGAAASGLRHGGLPALGSVFAGLFGAESGETTFRLMVWAHSLLVLGFLNYLPFGKHFHVITALPNTFVAPQDPPGRVRPILDIEDRLERMEEDPSVALGIGKAEDLTWKQVLDVYSCTECGRCVPFCPAWSTNKPLSHRDVNKSIRKHLREREDELIARAHAATYGSANGNGHAAPNNDDIPLLTSNAVLSETIWSCTLCKDCEDRCPVLIEQVPRIVQMRQYLTMILGDMPAEMANYFKNIERNSNPWGLAPEKRGEWIEKAAKDGIPVRRFAELSPEEQESVEYLFFVGCMGSFDDRANKVTRALCKILNAAGVSFAVLGEEEMCNGETARRLGNEYLAQTMMTMNIQTMMGYGVRKILSFCPHCFNTLSNEYGDFIGKARETHDDAKVAEKYANVSAFEVVHANTLVKQLVDQGRVRLSRDADLGEVAYHDPCFLGRYNGIFDAQRELLAGAGASVREPSLSRDQSYCCGAGGGRMWMEEHAPRVNHARFDEIMKTCGEPKTIGVSCPFCMTMMTDSSKDRHMEDKVQVKDVLEIVADRMVSA